MSIESLKQTARRHEQSEEWQKALHYYTEALAELAREEQVDIGLYNRVGDLYVRVGDVESAFEHYDKAVDLYREAYLPNNAIAVCKKIIRNMPNRPRAYLRIGQIRAEQGFIPDARENFLIYADHVRQSGDLDESFRALIEFCDLSPDDVGVRVTLAENMAANGRAQDAVEQLLVARQHLAQKGDQAQADEIERKVLTIDPDADLTAVPAGLDVFGGDAGEIQADFGEIAMAGSDGFDVEAEGPDLAGAMWGGGDEEDDAGFQISASSTSVDEFASVEGGSLDDEVVPELPTMALDEADEDEEVVELPLMDLGDADEEGEAPELPLMEVDEIEVGSEPVDEQAAKEVAEAFEEALEDAASHIARERPLAQDPSTEIEEPSPTSAAPSPTSEAPSSEAVGPSPTPEPAAPRPEAGGTPPPAVSSASGGYIDLGAMVLGGEEEKSTRFTVEYEEPSGDEEADFAKMLSQFKEKVAENLDSSDVRAHYDLGTAYKEMGLLDEAINSFQAALRASGNHLPTYELMGQTFIEMGRPEAAVQSLRRALQANAGVEDELVAIYYYLARAYEALEEREAAVEYYDRVFSLDINFADVTERLRELR